VFRKSDSFCGKKASKLVTGSELNVIFCFAQAKSWKAGFQKEETNFRGG
jgi:hypothetical protein